MADPEPPSGGDDLKVPLHDLRKRPRSRRTVHLEAAVQRVEISDSRVDPETPVVIDIEVESVAEGVTVAGTIGATWLGQCNLCLDQVSGDLAAHVNELFAEQPLDEETYQLDQTYIDLAPMVNDALMLELPIVVRCPFGGLGECDRVPPELAAAALESLDDSGEDSGDAPDRRLADPRWAALDALDFDEG